MFRMDVGPPIQPQVYAMNLDSSFGNSNLCVCSYADFQPSGINTYTTHHSAVSAFVLLWLGLSATGSLLRPVAHYDAVLYLGSVFSRRAAGAKHNHEGSKKLGHSDDSGWGKPTQVLINAVTGQVKSEQGTCPVTRLKLSRFASGYPSPPVTATRYSIAHPVRKLTMCRTTPTWVLRIVTARRNLPWKTCHF